MKDYQNMVKTTNFSQPFACFLRAKELKCNLLKKRANHSRHSLLKNNSLSSLFCNEQQERFDHGRSFVKSLTRAIARGCSLIKESNFEQKSKEQKSKEPKSEDPKSQFPTLLLGFNKYLVLKDQICKKKKNPLDK